MRRGWVLPRTRQLLAASEELVLDCGDGVRLQAFRSSPARAGIESSGRTAVLLHGWEGSADSLYILSLAQQLFGRGFEIVRLNLRDHGHTHHLNQELFHSCRLAEVVGAVRGVRALLPHSPLHLFGFSLGGNFMLRVAAQSDESGLDIARVVAVSPVLDPGETLLALEQGFWGYQRYFMRKWLSSLLKKEAAWPDHYDFTELRKLGDIRSLTAELVRRFTEYATLEEYLDGYSITGDRLARLRVPSMLITALDDPIIPPSGLQRLARPSTMSVLATRYGGHCGFLEHLSRPSWAERRIVAAIDGG